MGNEVSRAWYAHQVLTQGIDPGIISASESTGAIELGSARLGKIRQDWGLYGTTYNTTTYYIHCAKLFMRVLQYRVLAVYVSIIGILPDFTEIALLIASGIAWWLY